MSQVDWFRHTTWGPSEAAAFAVRLRRSRSAFNKAQYLRIQALHLQQGGSPELSAAALVLLDELLTKWPDPSQLASAHVQRAECLTALGRSADALEAYRDALRARRKTPNWRTDAHLGFGELVVSLRRTDLYDDALRAIEEFGDDAPLPLAQYRAAVVQALIADARGSAAQAGKWARAALEAAQQRESPFPRHKGVGLVVSTDPAIVARLRRLSEGHRDLPPNDRRP